MRGPRFEQTIMELQVCYNSLFLSWGFISRNMEWLRFDGFNYLGKGLVIVRQCANMHMNMSERIEPIFKQTTVIFKEKDLISYGKR